MRCIHNSVYNAHTDPLFRTSQILKFDDLYKLEVSKLVYDAMHAILPKPLTYAYQANIMVHDHGTRQRNNPHVQRSHTLVAKKLSGAQSTCYMGSATIRNKGVKYEEHL